MSAIGATQHPESSLIRKGLLFLVTLGVAGTATELIFLHHWKESLQLIAFASLGALALALALVVFGGPSAIRIGRWLALAVLVTGVIGVAIHVNVNLQEASEPENWGDAWATLSPIQQLWEATTGGTGDIPSLAPASLAQTALALLLATIHHPRLKR